MLILALSLSAEAGYVESIGEEIIMNPNGTFHRTAPNGDDGWLFMVGSGQNYVYAEVDNDHAFQGAAAQMIPDFTQMVDRSISRCPDKGWLLAASGNVDEFDDTLWVWRLDEDFNILAHHTLVDRDTSVASNDMATVCSTFFSGVGIVAFGGRSGQSAILFELDGQGNLVEEHRMSDLPQLQGGSIIAEEDTQTLLFAGTGPGHNDNTEVLFVRTDADLNVQSSKTVDFPLPAGERLYWPQGLMRAGDLYLLVHMARDESDGFVADEGNVWLEIMDEDLNVLETRQISTYEPPSGCMRPGFSRRGETLAMSWDANNVPTVVDVELDLSGAAVPGDSGEPVEMPDDSDPNTDDSGGGDDGGGGGCGGCAAGGGLAGAWIFGMAALWMRRRR